jgi:hypothetical protein
MSALAGIVVSTISPAETMQKVKDLGRKSDSKQMQTALFQVLLDHGSHDDFNFPEGEDNAKPICKPGIDSTECTNLGGLVLSGLSEHITEIPIDSIIPEDEKCTGYMAYQHAGRVHVFSPNLGKRSGDSPEGTCSSEEESGGSSSSSSEKEFCFESCITDLVSKNNGSVGDIAISQPYESDTIDINLKTDENWHLIKSYLDLALDIGNIPVNNKNNPKLSKFKYNETHNPKAQEYTYEIDSSEFTCGNEYFFAINSNTHKYINGKRKKKDVSWGDGTSFGGTNGATYFSCTIDCCE